MASVSRAILRGVKIALAISCPVLMLVLASWLGDRNQKPQTSENASARQPGDVVGVVLPLLTAVVVATDVDALSEVAESVTGKDRAKLVTMKSNGRLFIVEVGANVEVIENGLVALHIRVLDGQQRGKSGWVETIYFRNAVVSGKAR